MLGVKVKGEGKNCELAECAMRGRVSAEAHLHTRENGERNTTEGGEWEESRRVARKRREERWKRRRVSQESPQVFIFKMFHVEKTKLFLAKTADIQNKKFTFALDKTQLSLFPAALRHSYSAKSRDDPDESAQMLFDLLKKSRYSAVGEHREESRTKCCDYPQWKKRSTRAAISRGLSATSARRVRSP